MNMFTVYLWNNSLLLVGLLILIRGPLDEHGFSSEGWSARKNYADAIEIVTKPHLWNDHECTGIAH